MRWGKKWGRLKIEKGFSAETLWGAERNAGDVPISGRQQVRLVRGRIVPCDSCKRISYCAMYHSLTRHRLRNGRYLSGTNVLHMCDIYISRKMPGDVRSHHTS